MNLQPPAALEPLLSAIIDGTLTSEQRQQLAEVLASDKECRSYYVKYIRVISMLEYMHGGLSPVLLESEALTNKSLVQEVFEEEEQALRELEKHKVVAELQSLDSHPKPSIPRLKYRLYDVVPAPVMFAGLAASLLIIGLLLFGPKDPQGNNQAAGTGENGGTYVTTLTSQRDAKWQNGGISTEFQNGVELQVGQLLTLTEGFAEITTQRGAIAVLEAPVSVEILDRPNAIGLQSGKLVGVCHTSASKGFIVKTNHADITDLSTEFGVEVTGNGVTATVFVGEINITPLGGQSQLITSHQTARLEVDGNDRNLVVEDQVVEGYTRRLPRAPVVSDARITLDGFKIQVVPQGVFEDALLFTDRDYELNGIDENGLPGFLLGGDLVRMPVDARSGVTPEVGDKLALSLDLSVESDVYILKSNITNAQDWLKRDYENTGLFVGVDFSKDVSNGKRRVERGAGPGVSIDRPFEIWKRKQPASGSTIVAGTTSDSMYGVIVVPREP